MNHTHIGMAVLLAFSATFFAICIWAYWPTNRLRLQSYGLIPLQEDTDNVEEN
ncbi:cbb3-type cytochrome oxidase subunit 3 [Asticcacaulis sp. AC466]|uniref:cbb3-type cytochrome oxidase subunit 3 n=1 Tax=Asticcacaulis sp. AC466 TaxID=1282362 RepID=UPI0009DD3A5E|nr:cbb3-type cytochrome c oxidase subunit 3 [Asticcacaulis sp. AC466]